MGSATSPDLPSVPDFKGHGRHLFDGLAAQPVGVSLFREREGGVAVHQHRRGAEDRFQLFGGQLLDLPRGEGIAGSAVGDEGERDSHPSKNELPTVDRGFFVREVEDSLGGDGDARARPGNIHLPQCLELPLVFPQHVAVRQAAGKYVAVLDACNPQGTALASLQIGKHDMLQQRVGAHRIAVVRSRVRFAQDVEPIAEQDHLPGGLAEPRGDVPLPVREIPAVVDAHHRMARLARKYLGELAVVPRLLHAGEQAAMDVGRDVVNRLAHAAEVVLHRLPQQFVVLVRERGVLEHELAELLGRIRGGMEAVETVNMQRAEAPLTEGQQARVVVHDEEVRLLLPQFADVLPDVFAELLVFGTK